MKKLAIDGGCKTRIEPFPRHTTIGEEEKKAILEVLENEKLSDFLGTWGNKFYGGEQVRLLEKEWSDKFGVKHAIAVNSATSGLYCAVGATKVEPGDEIIVSPYTMSASATAPLVYNAIPVFADIESDYFCLDANSIEEKITSKTKAIIVVDIFGHPYDSEKINEIAKRNNLIVIEDAAQAPGAMYGEKYAGTLGDIGVFSLNYHKHIHCGEGGIVVTDNDELADRIRLIRNHGESVVENMEFENIENIMGFNYRMTEIEAAIARQQLKKLDDLLKKRLSNVAYLNKQLSKFPFLELPKIRELAKHAFYVHAIKYRDGIIDMNRDEFVEALREELTYFEGRESEGVKVGGGYVKPLYLLPMYVNTICYGKNHYPFCLKEGYSDMYYRGLAPVTELMHYKTLITNEFMIPSMKKEDIDDVISAIQKIYDIKCIKR